MADAETIEYNDSVRMLAAQKYLEDIQKYRAMIEKCTNKIDYYKQRAYSVGGFRYDRIRVQSSNREKNAAFAGYLEKLDKMNEKYNDNYFGWKCRTLNPLNSIGKLTNLDFQYLLRLRYSSGKAWKEIQDGLQCEDIYQMRDQALIALSYVMESEGKLQSYVDLLQKTVI